MGITCYHIEKAKISGPKECESQIKEEKYEEADFPVSYDAAADGGLG